jgi:hypothetical protein
MAGFAGVRQAIKICMVLMKLGKWLLLSTYFAFFTHLLKTYPPAVILHQSV